MRLFAVTLIVAALGMSACGSAVFDNDANDNSTGSAASPVAEATAEAPQEPTATATPVPAQTVSDSGCGGSLEGCFGYNEMDDYVSAVIPMVQRYFTTTYGELPEPEIVYIPNGRIARTYCGTSDSQAYEYCTGNNTIYIGQDLIWAFYRQAGDAAPAVALAHEWGHHLQSMLGVPFARSQSQAIAFENQADCISGAWAQYADDQGWLEDDDLGDIETLLQLIGSRESRARDHGTTAERAEAFQLSYESGIEACNAYFPNSPVG